MQRFSPSSPTCPNPPMTYDEASMQGSRHFFMALQELKNLRPQLYSAAEYCESSYLFNDQKQVVLDNLKDYTVKALVNAVDHLGTVAYKLNEVLSQQTSDITSAEIRITGLSQRIRICQVRTKFAGLNHQRVKKSSRRYHKHYVLPDAMHSTKEEKPGEKEPGKSHGPRSKLTEHVADTGRTLSWHLAADPLAAKKGTHSIRQGTSKSASSGGGSGRSMSEPEVSSEHAASSSGQATMSSPLAHTQHRGHSQSLASHGSFDERYKDAARGPVTSRSKSLLSTLLGRRRSGKSRGQFQY